MHEFLLHLRTTVILLLWIVGGGIVFAVLGAWPWIGGVAIIILLIAMFYNIIYAVVKRNNPPKSKDYDR